MRDLRPTGGELLIDTSSGGADFRLASPRADITFVIDTTGSMSDKIEGLLQTCGKFADKLVEKCVDWRIAVVSFGDLTVPGDKICATAYMDDVKVIKRCLKKIPRNDGGANEGESSLEALSKALAIPGGRKDSIRVFVLITDEPALQSTCSPGEVSKKLRSSGIITYVVSPDIPYFREMAKFTGGKWYLVAPNTDFTGIVRMFDSLATHMTTRIEHIQLKAGGDVSKFLRLPGVRE